MRALGYFRLMPSKAAVLKRTSPAKPILQQQILI